MTKFTEGCIWFGVGLYGALLVGCVVVALSMLIWVKTASADERMDNLQSMDAEEYCTVVADEFLAGVLNQAYGSARVIKHASPEMIERVEHGLPIPKDAMYMPEWNDHTAAEQEFVRGHVMTGYDEAAKIGREVTDEEAYNMARAYYQKCKRDRNGAALESPFRHVEALENVAPAKRIAQCTEWLHDHQFIGKAVAHGRDCDQMKQWTADTPDVPDERRAKIARILIEACAAQNVQAWFDQYWQACLEGHL